MVQREMQKNNPTSKKNTFSNLIYRTNHRFRGRLDNDTFGATTHKHLEPVPEPQETPACPSVFDICTQTNFKSLTSVDLKKTPRKVNILKERCTQTSKTVITLEEVESPRYSPDSLSPNQYNMSCLQGSLDQVYESGLPLNELDSLCLDRKHKVLNYLSSLDRDLAILSGNTLTKVYLQKNRSKVRHTVPEVQTNHQRLTFSPKQKKELFKSQSFVEPQLANRDVIKTDKLCFAPLKNTPDNKSNLDHYTCPPCMEASVSGGVIGKISPIKAKRSFSFMSPTISSEIKDQRIEIECIKKLISPTRRGRSASPKNDNITVRPTKTKVVPYFDKSQLTIRTDLCKSITDDNEIRLNLNTSCEVLTCTSALDTSISNTSTECALFQAIAKLRDKDWNKSLRGLAEIVEICRLLDPDVVYPHMTIVNQRLIELIKSPRSHVCRTSCQAVGHIFEYVKDTRRPEFDELVDTLLSKTADSNKFIRHDANLALDCMVTHIPTFHAVRALCSKGPDHKNSLVRTAAARLLVCAVVIAGPQNILNPHNNEYTRRRIILNMVKLLEDRCREIRKFGERLYKLFYKDRIFDLYLKRYLERDIFQKIKLCLKSINGQKL